MSLHYVQVAELIHGNMRTAKHNVKIDNFYHLHFMAILTFFSHMSLYVPDT